MTERQMEKEVQRTALDFEREIKLGYQMDNRSKGMVGGPDVLDAMLKKTVPRNSVLVEKTKALRYRGTAA